ncbi:mitochondrial ribosomal protein L54 [Brevipalpus obovatus]|uniref:mitochondrial ribosomal protein L54 n=1 Tax=Brevipalpus obovatus TaxID=246614 RepID=UPI003D9F0D92
MFSTRLNTNLVRSSRTCITIITRGYPAPTQPTSLGQKRFRELPVEKDPERLVNYCCGANYFIEGEDPKLKDDSEYPDWIWTMKIHELPHPDDHDPKSKEYWELAELEHLKRMYKLVRMQPKPTMTMSDFHQEMEDRIVRLRERAIMPEAIDHGYEPKEIQEYTINPRIYLRPELSEDTIPADRLEMPPVFDKKQMYQRQVFFPYAHKSYDDIMYRTRKSLPRGIPKILNKWHK